MDESVRPGLACAKLEVNNLSRLYFFHERINFEFLVYRHYNDHQLKGLL